MQPYYKILFASLGMLLCGCSSLIREEATHCSDFSSTEQTVLSLEDINVAINAPKNGVSRAQFKASYELNDQAFKSIGKPVRYLRLGSIGYCATSRAGIGANYNFEVRKADPSVSIDQANQETVDSAFFGEEPAENRRARELYTVNVSGGRAWRCWSVGATSREVRYENGKLSVPIASQPVSGLLGEQCYTPISPKYFLHIFSIYSAHSSDGPETLSLYRRTFSTIVSGVDIFPSAANNSLQARRP